VCLNPVLYGPLVNPAGLTGILIMTRTESGLTQDSHSGLLRTGSGLIFRTHIQDWIRTGSELIFRTGSGLTQDSYSGLTQDWLRTHTQDSLRTHSELILRTGSGLTQDSYSGLDQDWCSDLYTINLAATFHLQKISILTNQPDWKVEL